jgi:tetratricopeptide (TPR) repeat protein
VEIELSFGSTPHHGAYPVTMRVDGDGPRAEGSFRPPFTDATAHQAHGWLQRDGPEGENAKRVGAQLFNALFGGALGELYRTVRQPRATGPRVRVVADDPAVTRIPWELLYDPDLRSFVVGRYPVVRYLPGLDLAAPDLAALPPQILIADAAPRGVSRSRRALDAAALEAALAGLTSQERLHVATMTHTTLAGLRVRLLAAAATDSSPPFHVLHLICPTRVEEATGQVLLLLEDDDGQPDPVVAEDLAAALHSLGIRLVLLDLRDPGVAGTLGSHAYAPTLLRAGIPALVGMRITTLQTAPNLMRAFYGALADGQPVQEALAQATQPATGPGDGDQATPDLPVCYLTTGTGQLFKPLRPAWWSLRRGWGTTRRWIALTVAILGFIATVLGLYDAYERRVKGQPPTRMTGHVNVVVAEFGLAGGDQDQTRLAIAKDLAWETANQLRRQLQPEADQDLRIEVRGPGDPDIGPIRGATQLERQDHAEKLSGAINAHVVVYGELGVGPLGTSLRPEFYLSSDLVLRGAEELIDAQAGEHRLGAAIQRPGDVAENQLVYGDLHTELAARVKVLADVAAGLVFLNNSDRAAEAAPFFQAAETVKGWDDDEGKEVLYLLLGNAKLRWFSQTIQLAPTRPGVARQMLHDAADHYRQALRLDPQYARAQLGLAEATFLRAQGSCQPGRTDRAGLERAARLFATAGRSANQPHTADVGTKVAFGLGRTYVCLTSAGVNRQSQARQELSAVLRDYSPAPGNHNPRVQLLAAEAHGQLGALDYVLGTTTRSRQRYQAAAASYQQALELSAGRPDRQWKFYDVLAAVYQRLGDTTQAKQAARNADAARQAADLPPLDRP